MWGVKAFAKTAFWVGGVGFLVFSILLHRVPLGIANQTGLWVALCVAVVLLATSLFGWTAFFLLNPILPPGERSLPRKYWIFVLTATVLMCAGVLW